jgi:methylated-DNA-[protein]-cysteine S-methyltransferase
VDLVERGEGLTPRMLRARGERVKFRGRARREMAVSLRHSGVRYDAPVRLRERWRSTWLADPRLPLVIMVDADDALVYVGFSLETRPRLHDLRKHAARHGAELEDDPRPLTAAAQQLHEYLQGARRVFDLPLRLLGTPFQRHAWAALCEIPYGETRSYGQQTMSMGRDPLTVTRAVGQANGQNPISIVVPCHRVIGADNKLTGFGGGIEAKKWLLELERRGAPPEWAPRPGPRNPGAMGDQLTLFVAPENQTSRGS